ncbi:MAG: carboxylating nicotinate-nucleotide diphosphorylase [Acidobacteriota bacterium]
MDSLNLDPLLRQALSEDLGRGDITTNSILPGPLESSPPRRLRAQAVVNAKQELVLAGWPVFRRVFELLGGDVHGEPLFPEGATVGPGVIGALHAEAFVLLRGERVALNLLQRLCGVATQTGQLVKLVSHTDVKILDTRKTTPLWRGLEKYAVRIGGGHNHRMGLDDGVLIKENHIAVAGGIEVAIESCRKRVSPLHKIEVEVRNLEEMEIAIEAGADLVLLDNMTPDQVAVAVRRTAGRCPLEVSGGVSRDTVVAYAESGVDFISLGALTHSYRCPDISMLLQTE